MRNHMQPWTPSMKCELRTYHQSGYSIARIADLMGRTPLAVQARLVKMGLVDKDDLPQPAHDRPALQAEINRLTQSRDDLSARNAALDDANLNLNIKIKELEALNATLAEDNACLRDRNAALAENIKKARAQRDELRAQNATLAGDNASLGERLAKLENEVGEQCLELGAVTAEEAEDARAIEELTNRLIVVETQLRGEACSQLATEINTLDARVDYLEMQVAADDDRAGRRAEAAIEAEELDELAEDAGRPFQVGDRVRVAHSSICFAGREGTVIETDRDYFYKLEVFLDASKDLAERKVPFNADELELLPAAPAAPAPRPHQAGDVVRVVDNGGPVGLEGKHGIVYHVDERSPAVGEFSLTADFAEVGGMPLRVDEIAQRVGHIEPGMFGTVAMVREDRDLKTASTRLELLKALDAEVQS